MPATILYVEDEFTTRLLVLEALRGRGYHVDAVASAEEASRHVEQHPPDLVVLDWVLPGESGYDLLRRWRADGHRFPVILLSARDTVEHRVQGLEAGANDYVIKPFAIEELLARVAVQLRERGGEPHAELRLGPVRVDLEHELVHNGGKQLRLTTLEARTLQYLAARPGQTVPRDELLREVWGFPRPVRTRAVDNTISRLRGKIEPEPNQPRHIITVHGVGYRFQP
ncbi:MAG: DNA-binding response regulator [Planctomycetota bacterium]|nr:MAG: DNA-binding response regulator [Planctomycetota bacterium]